MGQQQLLLIILGVIIVGIAIAVGLSMFTAQSIGANKDAIMADITNMSANAYQFRIRPVAMGGGGGTTYVGYRIPSALDTTDNAVYTMTVTPWETAATITFTGTSQQDPLNIATATYGADGRLIPPWVFTAEFQ